MIGPADTDLQRMLYCLRRAAPEPVAVCEVWEAEIAAALAAMASGAVGCEGGCGSSDGIAAQRRIGLDLGIAGAFEPALDGGFLRRRAPGIDDQCGA